MMVLDTVLAQPHFLDALLTALRRQKEKRFNIIKDTENVFLYIYSVRLTAE